VSSAQRVARNNTPLSDPQHKVWSSPARFRVLVAGRRFGKTYLDVHEMVRAAMTGHERRVWFIAPTYRQAKQVVWSDLMRMVPPHMIERKDESDLSITLTGYRSVIALRGADNPDSLRGPGLDFAIFDEYADIDPRAWPEVVRPMLSDRQGEAIFTGTPRGFDHFYQLWVEANERSSEGWATFQFTTLEGGNVPAHEIEAARRDLSARVFRQEYEASFEAVAGRVYDSFSRSHQCSASVADLGSTLHVGMDFNVNPMSAVLASQAGDELHAHDEIVLPNATTEIMAKEIQAFIQRWRVARAIQRGDGKAEVRDVVVYPDPSGNARKTSAVVGQTDFTILKDAGFHVVAGRQQPPVVDRINEVNALCCDASGRRRLHVHPRCSTLLRSLEGLTYREGTSQPDKSTGLDHITDALGYMVHEMFPLVVRSYTAGSAGVIGV